MKPKYFFDEDGNPFYVNAKIKDEKNVKPYCVAVTVCKDTRRFYYKTLAQALNHYVKLGKERSLATIEKNSVYDIELTECGKRGSK